MPPKKGGKGKGKGSPKKGKGSPKEKGKGSSPNAGPEEPEIIREVPVGIMTHRMKYILNSQVKSDCEFIFGPEHAPVKVPVHKCVLSAESPVLSELLHRVFVPPTGDADDPKTKESPKQTGIESDGGGKGKGKGKGGKKGKKEEKKKSSPKENGKGGKKGESGKGSSGGKGGPSAPPLGAGKLAEPIDGCFSEDIQLSETEYRVLDVHVDGFYKLLRYLYHDEIVYNGVDGVLRTLYAARKYLIPVLARACVEYLENNINLDTILRLLKASFFFHEDHLKALCMQYIINHTFDVVSREEFIDSELRMVNIILLQDILNIREIDLFSRVMNWAEKECERIGIIVTGRNQRIALRTSFELIRFPTVTPHEFACHVVPTECLTHPEIITILSYFVTGHKPNVPFSCEKRRRPALAVDDVDRESVAFSDQTDLTFVGNPHLNRRCTSMQDIMIAVRPFADRVEKIAHPRVRRASAEFDIKVPDEIQELVYDNLRWYKRLHNEREAFEYAKEHMVFLRKHWR